MLSQVEIARVNGHLVGDGRLIASAPSPNLEHPGGGGRLIAAAPSPSLEHCVDGEREVVSAPSHNLQFVHLGLQDSGSLIDSEKKSFGISCISNIEQENFAV